MGLSKSAAEIELFGQGFRQSGQLLGRPRVAASNGRSATGRDSCFASHIPGAEVLVEGLGAGVLVEHPEVNAAAGVLDQVPRGDLGEETAADAAAVKRRTDMQVVDKRSPLLVVCSVSADEAGELVAVFGEDDMLVGLWGRQALVPDQRAVL